MRLLLITTVVAGGVLAFAQDVPAELKDRPLLASAADRTLLGDGTVLDAPLDPLSKAKAEVARRQALVDAGVLPRTALEKAERDLLDAEDEVILNRTLYGAINIEDLTSDDAQKMVAAAERQMQRQSDRLAGAKKLVDEGVAARTTLTPFLEDLDAKRKAFDLAISRARLLTELAELASAEEQALEDNPSFEPSGPLLLAERFDGDGLFSDADFKRVAAAYQQKFARPLPISARGATALHKSLGFDHRGRVDVALSPDQEEGSWLIRFMKNARLPYFAFRAAIRGKATGPHIHMGPPSTRYRAAD